MVFRCNIVSMIQVLSIFSIVTASVYLESLAGVCSFMDTSHTAHPHVVIGSCNSFQVCVTIRGGSFDESISFDMRSSVYWILALSLLTIAYQGLAIFQLFFKVQVLNTKKVFCKTIWTVFSLVVSQPPPPHY